MSGSSPPPSPLAKIKKIKIKKVETHRRVPHFP